MNMHRNVTLLTTVVIGFALAACAPTPNVDDRAAFDTPTVDDRAAFDTPEAAVDALLAAALVNDREALVRIFGTEHRSLVETPDAAAERVARRDFWDSAQVVQMLEERRDNERILIVGRELWPFPIPIVRGQDGWQFDTKEGFEEIIDRRVGGNEIVAITLCREYVEAQLEYIMLDRDGDEVLEYAQRFTSSTGKHDGLYWPTDVDANEPLSPFGELVASSERHLDGRAPGDPFEGYFFRILTDQGSNPPGGAYEYVINDNMIAGFAMIAVPAEYGSTGVMSFIVNQQGKVYDKDLGPDTLAVARKLTSYDPDDSWNIVAD